MKASIVKLAQRAGASMAAKTAASSDWYKPNYGKTNWGEHLTHGAELAGLGVLAVPSYKRLKKIRQPETSPQERSDAKHELAGLGILAAPSAIHLAHSAYKRLRR